MLAASPSAVNAYALAVWYWSWVSRVFAETASRRA
jgi:hypothetical protein